MFNVELPPDSSWKWRTGITTEDQNEVQRLEKRIKVLEDALRDIARQNLESEIHEDYREDADYRGAYDCIIRVARASLEVKP